MYKGKQNLTSYKKDYKRDIYFFSFLYIGHAASENLFRLNN
jgi:hypothetical protein